MYNELHEECGVFGVYSRDGPGRRLAVLLWTLRLASIAARRAAASPSTTTASIHCHKGAGLVSDIFTPEALHSLGTGQMAVAHVRYGTMGTDPRLNAQPLVVNHIKAAWRWRTTAL